MPWAAFPVPEPPAELDEVSAVLDPVLTPLGFAAGQLGVSDDAGQVVFCRGDWNTDDSFDGGCIDLVLDLAARPDWRVVDVRYWGFTADRWHLAFERGATLTEQLAGLASTLPTTLAGT